MEQLAQKILALVKAMVPGRFTTEPATPATHPHADWKAYARVGQLADSLGLQHLGDVDVTSVHQDSSMTKRAVLAVFVNDDGTEIIGHYRMALRWTPTGILARFLGGSGDVFDVGTNFGGGQGVLLETTTAQASSVWSMPDFVIRETLTRGTSLEHALERHRDRVREYRAQNRSARPTVVRTLSDVFAISDAMERRKLAWRRDLGWAAPDELARVTRLSGPAFDQFYEAFRNAASRSD